MYIHIDTYMYVYRSDFKYAINYHISKTQTIIKIVHIISGGAARRTKLKRINLHACTHARTVSINFENVIICKLIETVIVCLSKCIPFIVVD